MHLVAPTSGDERLRAAATASRGFVYLVANVGTTGARERARRPARRDRDAGAGGGRRHAACWAASAFRAPEHVEALLRAGADGAIVGSAAIDAAERGGPAELESLIRNLAGALVAG